METALTKDEWQDVADGQVNDALRMLRMSRFDEAIHMLRQAVLSLQEIDIAPSERDI